MKRTATAESTGVTADDMPPCIARFIEAYNARDVAAMVTFLSPDVHFINKSAGVITAETHGLDEFRDLAQQGVAAFSERRQTVTNCIASDFIVAVRVAYRAVVATDLPNGWKQGQVVEMSGTSVYRLKQAKIVELIDVS